MEINLLIEMFFGNLESGNRRNCQKIIGRKNCFGSGRWRK